MNDYGIDVEAEITFASRQLLKEELAFILKPFENYKNTPSSRNHAENIVKAWLSFKHKNNLIGDYATRCDVFNNQEPTKLIIDVAVKFHYCETSGHADIRKTTEMVFVPISVVLSGS